MISSGDDQWNRTYARGGIVELGKKGEKDIFVRLRDVMGDSASSAFSRDKTTPVVFGDETMTSNFLFQLSPLY
jgi:hypothetical protein